MNTVYVSLGSNIDPEKHLRVAAQKLQEQFSSISFSHVYRTAPQDEIDQPYFLNAVAMFHTTSTPLTVFATLESIEEALQKNPPYAKGPRTIDLDLLLWESDSPLPSLPKHLHIPHPRMHQRRFVLEPLVELNDSEQWKEMLKKTLDQECIKVDITL